MKLLVVASRPSDYVEMIDLAKALANRKNHSVKLLYFYSEPERAASDTAIGDMDALPKDGGLSAEAVEMDIFSRRLVSMQQVPQPADAGSAPLSQRSAHRVLGWLLRKLSIWGRRTRTRYLFPGRVRRFVAHRVGVAVADGIDAMWLRSSSALAAVRGTIGKGHLSAIPNEIATRAGTLQYYAACLSVFSDIIREGGYDAVLVPEDVVGYIWPSLIRAGHDQGIPTLVFPYTLANKEEPLQSLRDEPDYQAKNNPLTAEQYPRWRLRERGVDLLRLPSGHVFAHEELGIAPPDPWMMNSGYANVICVDSRASYDYFLAGGIPASKMEVVGSVSQDRMYARKRDRASHLATLRGELDLRGDKPLLLLSGCPNQLSAKVPRCEFADFAAIAMFIGESLRPLGGHYHLVVRPHPNFPEFGAMLEPYGFRSTQNPTSGLVPLADLFVAFASATIRWAIASGVPTVNYDIFGYGYGDFDSAAGVLAVDTRLEFAKAIGSLLPGSEAYMALARPTGGDKLRWGMMDGASLDRIEAAIQRECARRPVARTAA